MLIHFNHKLNLSVVLHFNRNFTLTMLHFKRKLYLTVSNVNFTLTVLDFKRKLYLTVVTFRT